jgi:hypothetical protein
VPSSIVNERVYLDIAVIKSKDEMVVTNPNWLIKVDEKTKLKFSSFHSSKKGMVEPTCEQFFKWMTANKLVKYVRCDNAGENKLLEQRANSVSWKLNLEFEYTARNTPQQNSDD